MKLFYARSLTLTYEIGFLILGSKKNILNLKEKVKPSKTSIDILKTIFLLSAATGEL